MSTYTIGECQIVYTGSRLTDEIIRELLPLILAASNEQLLDWLEEGTRVGAGEQGTVYKISIRGYTIAAKDIQSPYTNELLANAIVTRYPDLFLRSFAYRLFDDRALLFMEFVPVTLARILDQCQLDYDLISLIINQVFDSIVQLANHKILHQDLTPDNLFIAPRGTGLRAVVGDFGSSRPLLSQTGSDEDISRFLSRLRPMIPDLDFGDLLTKVVRRSQEYADRIWPSPSNFVNAVRAYFNQEFQHFKLKNDSTDG